MKILDLDEKCNMRIRMKAEVVEVDTFRYLEVNFTTNGKMDAELNYWSMEVRKFAVCSRVYGRIAMFQ